MPDNKRTFPATVKRQIGIDNDQLLELLSGRGVELEGIAPFFWSAEISSNRLDAYYSRMHTTTLTNFAKNAQAGVSFLDSHDSRKLGFGQSLTGDYESNDKLERVTASFYTVPGIKFGGQHSYQSTDDFILAVRSGIARDVSVGFWGGTETCDICGQDIWGWSTECPHFPGVSYDIAGEQILCTSTIKDGELVEVSAVYDGATPEAMILKANNLVQQRLLPDTARLMIEHRYNFRIETRKVKAKESNAMSFEQTFTDLTQDIQGSNSREKLENLLEVEQEAQQLRRQIDKINAEIERLRPLADLGEQYRTRLIEDALTEGVRAFGDKFQRETYQGMLSTLKLEQIELVLADWRTLGHETIPAGRQTEDSEPDRESVEINPIPSAAYRS